MYKYTFTGEGQEDERISFKELRARVTVLASALKKLGVKKGDRVAGMNDGFQNCKNGFMSPLSFRHLIVVAYN